MRAAARLREARLRGGLSHEMMATLVGVTRQAYANWEKGARIPDVDHALKVAEVLNVPVEELFADVTLMRLQRKATRRNGAGRHA